MLLLRGVVLGDFCPFSLKTGSETNPGDIVVVGVVVTLVPCMDGSITERLTKVGVFVPNLGGVICIYASGL
jgi:hypothetical protein